MIASVLRAIAAGLALALALAAGSCGGDAAHREYITALDGEERGMSREDQIAHLDRAIALKPRRGEYYETRSGYRTDLRDFPAALADLDRARALRDRPYLHFRRGLLLCETGDYRGSLADFDLAIAGQPKNTQFFRGRSLARSAQHDGVGALADAETLIARVPQQAESHYAKGAALVVLGRDREAIVEFDEAIRQRPELVYPLVARAQCYERLGEPERAAWDRRAVERKSDENAGCAMCLDPFRY